MDAGMIRTIGEQVASPEYRGNPSPLSTQSKDVRSRRKAKDFNRKVRKERPRRAQNKVGFQSLEFQGFGLEGYVRGDRRGCEST
jgi:hypothetical protein